MPELPEVESLARSLAPKIKGKTCTKIVIFDKKLVKPPPRFKNLRIIEVLRFGKEVSIKFHDSELNQDLFLLVHLRMSGRLLFLKNKQNKELSKILNEAESYLQHKIIRIKSDNFLKHVRAAFCFKDSSLYFFDVRRFGTFKWSIGST